MIEPQNAMQMATAAAAYAALFEDRDWQARHRGAQEVIHGIISDLSRQEGRHPLTPRLVSAIFVRELMVAFGEGPITNRWMAHLYGLSANFDHLRMADAWFAANPEEWAALEAETQQKH